MDTIKNQGNESFSLQGKAKPQDFNMKNTLARNITSLEIQIEGIEAKIRALQKAEELKINRRYTLIDGTQVSIRQIPNIYMKMYTLQRELDEKTKQLQDMKKQIQFFEEPKQKQVKTTGPKQPAQENVVEQKRDIRRPKKRKLPLKDGLQIYNKVLQESVKSGVKFSRKSALSTNPWIKGLPIVVTSGATAIGTIVLPGIGTYVGLGTGAILSSAIKPIVEKATGRKKDTDKIFKAIDNLPDEDLELMLDDFLLRGRDQRMTMRVKTHELFFDAIQRKCEQEMPNKIEQLKKHIEEERKGIKALKDGLTRIDNPETISLYNSLILEAYGRIDYYEQRANRWADYSRLISEAKKNNSLERHKNLGGIFARRNINNTKAVKRLASMDYRRLEAEYYAECAEKAGNIEEQKRYLVASKEMKDKMREYMASKTAHAKIGKNTYSIGAFEAPRGEIKVISTKEYAAEKITYGIAAAAITAVAMANRIFKFNKLQNEKIAASLDNTKKDLEGTVNAANVANSTKNEGLANHLAGERADFLSSNAKTTSPSFTQAEQVRMKRVVENINTTSEQTYDAMHNKGSVFSKLSKLFDVKSNAIRTGEYSGLEEASKTWAGKFGTTGGNGIDHTQTVGLEVGSSKIAETQANVFKQLSELVSKLDTFFSEKVQAKADYLPILIANAPLVGGIVKSMQDKKVQTNNRPQMRRMEKGLEI